MFADENRIRFGAKSSLYDGIIIIVPSVLHEANMLGIRLTRSRKVNMSEMK